MTNKGFEANVIFEETPNFKKTAEKPLMPGKFSNKRVDINVLKARAKATQDKENRKSTIFIIFFLITLGAVGIFFSI